MEKRAGIPISVTLGKHSRGKSLVRLLASLLNRNSNKFAMCLIWVSVLPNMRRLQNRSIPISRKPTHRPSVFNPIIQKNDPSCLPRIRVGHIPMLALNYCYNFQPFLPSQVLSLQWILSGASASLDTDLLSRH